jgi:hypothetical protein
VRCRTDGQGDVAETAIIVNEPTEGDVMLVTIAAVLLVLWLLGLVSSYTLGGFIHVLLVIAVVMILVNFISGRRA